ncbi:MAG: MFS transporter [Chloroflexi bacterium]|nr:MFS transporter [Chloroflexota bacterium]
MKGVSSAAVASLRYRWVILFVCWLAYTVASMQRFGVGPLAPFLKEDLGLTKAQAGLFVTAAAFGFMLALIPSGWLVDRIGVRWLLLIGEVFGGIFVASVLTVTSFTQGLVLMALGGIGMGCILPATTKGVLVWFPDNERATAMGFKQTALNMAGIVTASTLPAVALALSWQHAFFIIGIAAIVVGIVSFVLYKPPPEGALAGTANPSTIPAARASVREVFQSRDIWLLVGTGVFFVVVEFAAHTYFVLYLQDVLLFTVVRAGFFLALLNAGGAFGKPLTGLMSDRLFHGSRKRVFMLIIFVTILMSLAFALLPQGSPSWLIVVLSLVMGYTGLGWGGLHLTLIGEFAGKELAGTVTGLVVVIVMLGNMAGPPLFGYIVDKTDSYRVAWQFLAIMSAVALCFLFFVREGKKKI